MTRTHYENGSEVGLKENGCDGCSPSVVNGILIHEFGCSDWWKDIKRECRECGCDFYPEYFAQGVCGGCQGEKQ